MISVRRHLTKNRPGLPQKSSETPSTALLVKVEAQGPRCAQGKGTQRTPLRKHCMASWRLFRLLQGCCGNCWYTSRIVVVTVLPTVGKQSSVSARDSDSRRVVFYFVTPSG